MTLSSQEVSLSWRRIIRKTKRSQILFPLNSSQSFNLLLLISSSLPFPLLIQSSSSQHTQYPFWRSSSYTSSFYERNVSLMIKVLNIEMYWKAEKLRPPKLITNDPCCPRVISSLIFHTDFWFIAINQENNWISVCFCWSVCSGCIVCRLTRNPVETITLSHRHMTPIIIYFRWNSRQARVTKYFLWIMICANRSLILIMCLS